jgi:hypothetical protein
MELNVRPDSRGINQCRVHLVGLLNPLFRCQLVTTEAHVTANETLLAQSRVDVDIPDFVEQRPHTLPVAVFEQEVVAFGDDERRLGRYRNRVGNGFFNLATEGRCVDRFVITLLAQSAQKRDIACAVERGACTPRSSVT